ncbi:MAG TPA: hypothetical protein DCL53_12925 [Thauera sp.]|nr:hypothetical protein [Thauera sp.]
MSVNNTLHQVKVGHYMGQNFGVVTAISEEARPLITATADISSTMVNGRPVDTAIACKATRPPPRISATATSPSKVHQNTR